MKKLILFPLNLISIVSFGQNVGIGTAAPGAKLEVVGVSSTSANNSLLIRNSALDTMFRVRNDGTVFIGNPAIPDFLGYRFRVESGNKGSLFIENPILTANATVRILRGVPENSPASTTALYVEASSDFASRMIGFGGIHATSSNNLRPAGEFISAPSGYAIQANGKLQLTGISEAAGKVLTSDAFGNATWNTLDGTHNHFGEMWTGDTTGIGLRIINTNSTGFQAAALVGQMTGGGNAGTRGVEGTSNSTDGIGVFGSNNSVPTSAVFGNSGVVGSAGNGTGVFGASVSGASIYGRKGSGGSFVGNAGKFENASATNTDPVVLITNVSTHPNPTALELNNGYIKVSGVNKTAFKHITAAGNISGNVTSLSYPNQDPDDLLIVTHNYNNGVSGTTGGTYFNKNFGTWWNGTNWTIYAEDLSTLPTGVAFTVMVIKQ